MPSPSVDAVEPLLKNTHSRRAPYVGRGIAVVSLLVGLRCLALLTRAQHSRSLAVHHLATQSPVTTMAKQYTQPTAPWQSTYQNAATSPLTTSRSVVNAPRHVSQIHAAPIKSDIYARQVETKRGDTVGDTISNASSSEAVVKVFSIQCSPRLTYPWANKPQTQCTGSAFLVEEAGKSFVITNAHVIADTVFIELRKAGDAKRYIATRERISHECDLALLNVEDPTFWEGMRPLSFGSMPYLQNEVSAVGYPTGGDGISVTKGVVSRIEIREYAHSGKPLLTIQVDAAINPGNSGGPVLNDDGHVIGVAFQNQVHSQNIGYVIPIPVIQHFLNDANPSETGKTRGFCSLGIAYQKLENEQMRRYLKMGENQTGIVLTTVSPCTASTKVLFRGDVILEVDGHTIANDGTFSVTDKERLLFAYLIQRKYSGEVVQLQLLRNGTELTVQVPVEPIPSLVPVEIYDTSYPYLLYGGILFLPLTQPYLKLWGQDWKGEAPSQLVRLLDSWRQDPAEQIVILSLVFPSKETQGYTEYSDRHVVSINDEKVLNLKQMYQLIQKLHKSEQYIRFELARSGGNQMITVDTSTADAVNSAIMKTHRIPAAVAPELVETLS